MPMLHLERHGAVPDEETRKILSLLQECYAHLRPDGLRFVEIHIFKDDHLWHSYMTAERRKAGVASAELDDAFIATHDAWTGIPRISISLERAQNLVQLVREGSLRHEVGHSILHGSLEHYVLPMPTALTRTGQDFPNLAVHLPDILYLLALAVKDMEVTQLLFSNGYLEDQAAYARFVMKTGEQDLQAWDLSSLASEARVLCLFGRLKDIAPATVLTSKPKVSQLDPDEVDKSIQYLPHELRGALIQTMNKILNALGRDTFTNIRMAATISVANVIEPVMGKFTSK